MKRKYINYCIIVLSLCISYSCKDYLDAKPDSKLATLSRLEDLQSLLDDSERLNLRWGYEAEASADDYYITDTELAALSKDGDRRMYTWEKNNIFQTSNNSWSYAYAVIYYGNSVLDAITKIERVPVNAETYDNIKGQAYFFKGAALLQAASVWAPAYDPATAESDLGMPLRASSDFNAVSVRSNLADTYAQLLSDLKHAAAFLAVNQVHVMRPCKAAAFAMLSRAYLSMNKYTEASLYADSALQLNSQLLDYNTLTASSSNPFPQYKGEVLFQMTIPNPAILNQSTAKIPLDLYNQYKTGDLRKTLFFKSSGSNWAFRGTYGGTTSLFFGPAVDEMYLNRSEGYARTGKLAASLTDLNALMLKRWSKTTAYVPYQSSDAETVLKWVLEERRKELLMRGLRWADVKRLNKLGANISISRTMNSGQKTLSPNDLRFALPIPEDVIALSGMVQNP
jgi:hypothetical protein